MKDLKQSLRNYYNKRAMEFRKIPATTKWEWGVGQTQNLVVKRSFDRCNRLFLESCPEKLVLDYGCGQGAFSCLAASNNAIVVGIDISEESIKNAKSRADVLGVSQRTYFLVMDCEFLGFREDSFDIIFSSGMLSCLEKRRAFMEWMRFLKPKGCVIGVDALGHNPLMVLARKLKAKLGLRPDSIAEHTLRIKDFDIARDYFEKVDVEYFHLATLLGILFKRMPGFSHFLKILEIIDSFLLKSPFLERYAEKVVFSFSTPKKLPQKEHLPII